MSSLFTSFLTSLFTRLLPGLLSGDQDVARCPVTMKINKIAPSTTR